MDQVSCVEKFENKVRKQSLGTKNITFPTPSVLLLSLPWPHKLRLNFSCIIIIIIKQTIVVLLRTFGNGRGPSDCILKWNFHYTARMRLQKDSSVEKMLRLKPKQYNATDPSSIRKC